VNLSAPLQANWLWSELWISRLLEAFSTCRGDPATRGRDDVFAKIDFGSLSHDVYNNHMRHAFYSDKDSLRCDN